MASPELAPAIPSSVIATALTSKQEAQVDPPSLEIAPHCEKRGDVEIDGPQAKWSKRCVHDLSLDEIKQLFDAVTFKLDIVLYRIRGFQPQNAWERQQFTAARASIIDALSEAIKDVAQNITSDPEAEFKPPESDD